ncbi:unnamed protein product [Echinostoma caproni]|uniref:ADP,ATP carrier protein n=1 Tax=Echinostoma caproni TaxID=27848 RepID=A0A183B0W3_9TREM|nr:unnamed protein product [Echinostoma caproni]
MGTGVGVSVAMVRVVTAYDQFVRSHQLTAWRTAEMAKLTVPWIAGRVYLTQFVTTLGPQLPYKTVGQSSRLNTGEEVNANVEDMLRVEPKLMIRPCKPFTSIPHGAAYSFAFCVNPTNFTGSSLFLFCINRGRRQMLVAAAVGALPGLAYGWLNLAVCRVLGLTFEDLFREQARAVVRHKLHREPLSDLTSAIQED